MLSSPGEQSCLLFVLRACHDILHSMSGSYAPGSHRFHFQEDQIIIAPDCACKAFHLQPMTKTFTRPAQLIKPFHRFTVVYANGLGSVGGKYIQRKE